MNQPTMNEHSRRKSRCAVRHYVDVASHRSRHAGAGKSIEIVTAQQYE